MFPKLGKQYQFIKEVGRGGTGVVNLAIDTHSGYPVAIKSLFANISKNNPEMLDKFRIEANIYLMLSNPKNFILRSNLFFDVSEKFSDKLMAFTSVLFPNALRIDFDD